MAYPKLSTIRTNSYMNIDEFYQKKILEKSTLEVSPAKETLIKRHKNYPWSNSSIQLAHDFSIKSVNNPKYNLLEKIRQKEAQRQLKASKNLYHGFSSSRRLQKLPPLNNSLGHQVK